MKFLLYAWMVWGVSTLTWAEDVAEMLSKMVHTARHSNYEALLVLHTPQKNNTSIQLMHKAADAHSPEQEKLIALDGAQQQVVTDGAGMLLYVPKEKNIQVIRNPFVDTFVRMAEKPDDYRIVYQGDERVAGRQAHRIHINAKDKWRYSYMLWVDKDSHMYLRAQWFDHAQLIADALVLNLKFHSVIEPFVTQKMPQLSVNQLEPPQEICTVSWLPKGFEMVRKNAYPPEGPGQTEHLVFSDGLAKISVYVDVSQSSEDEEVSLGRTNVYQRSLGQNRKVVVLGEAPQATIRKVAQSVVLK